jgi:hypothetical protein
MDKQRLGYTSSDSGQSAIGRVLTKVAAFAIGLTVLGVALMFSIVFFAVALTLGLIIAGRLWWKTRELRKQMRGYAAARQRAGERIIEGEVIHEQSERTQQDR